ncbi:hypothetical protein GCM10027395_27550 [Giesbergeria sinuosa]
MCIGITDLRYQRNATRIYNDVPFRAAFASVGRIWACLLPLGASHRCAIHTGTLPIDLPVFTVVY